MKIAAICFLVFTFIQTSKEAMEGFVVGGDFGNIVKFPHSAFLDARCNDRPQDEQNARRQKNSQDKQNAEGKQNAKSKDKTQGEKDTQSENTAQDERNVHTENYTQGEQNAQSYNNTQGEQNAQIEENTQGGQNAQIENNTQGGKTAHVKKNVKEQQDEHWICGSAILNQRILLTAAHCVSGCTFSDTSTDQIIALFGNANLKEVTIKRKVLDVLTHINYNEITMENDIAVAVVKKDIPFGPNVKRVMISRQFPENTNLYSAFVAGWGVVSNEKQVSSVRLKYVNQRLRSKKTCALVGHLHQGMFCAGSTEKDADHPAQGDSGSALVTDHGALQIGVVSFCLKRYPALLVYTNVSYYYQWIANYSQILYCRSQLF